MAQFMIGNNDFGKILSTMDIDIAHTYTGEIKRTLTGKVASFPGSFVTVGLVVTLIDDVVVLEHIRQLARVNKVQLTFEDAVYTCSGGFFSMTENSLERFADKRGVKGKLSMTFVTVGVPTIEPNLSTRTVTITAPDN